MAAATIIRAWQDATNANLVVAVVEASGDRVEYAAAVPLAQLSGTNAQKKAQLVAEVKAVRDAQIKPAETDLSALANGTVTI